MIHTNRLQTHSEPIIYKIWVLILLSAGVLYTFGGCHETTPKRIPCLDRAVFGDPAQSPYVLPYPVGKSYRLIQGYCYPEGGHRDQLAYDFGMPTGDDVVAARSGIVRKIRADVPDEGRETDAGRHNHILIQHDDGTVAFYGHLMQNSIVVKVGERVEAGRRIAASGNSGNTGGICRSVAVKLLFLLCPKSSS